MNKIIIGIDPGSNGAIAVNWGDNIEVFRESKQTLEDTFKYILMKRNHRPVKVYLEKVGAMPKQGVSSTFTFGYNYGRVVGALRVLGIAFEYVLPNSWQKGLGLPKCPPHYTPEQRRIFKAQHKKDLVQLAKDFFPNECKTNDCADALLIMRHGQKNET